MDRQINREETDGNAWFMYGPDAGNLRMYEENGATKVSLVVNTENTLESFFIMKQNPRLGMPFLNEEFIYFSLFFNHENKIPKLDVHINII